ncbi:MAG: hypothetical protein M1833_005708 [Piccolia ochrophora]|nr:MAG: hypothetical protein M1833_005708 [Piccolia ochrophora]
MEVSQIWIHPIKSLSGINVKSATLTREGLQYDRRFMLLRVRRDPQSSNTPRLENIHVQNYPQTALFKTALESSVEVGPEETIVVTHNGQSTEALRLPTQPNTSGLEIVEVIMHLSPTKAYVMTSHYNDWFTKRFGFEVILAYIGQNFRRVLGNFAPVNSSASQPGWLSTIGKSLVNMTRRGHTDEGIAFSDVAPLLLITEESLRNVSERLTDGEVAEVERFRPNIVVRGSVGAFDEDYWAEVDIGSTGLIVTQNCARCTSINVDYSTGMPAVGESGQLLKKLMSDRRVDQGTKYSPIFGRYAFVEKSSEGKNITVGDDVIVKDRNINRTHSYWPELTN